MTRARWMGLVVCALMLAGVPTSAEAGDPAAAWTEITPSGGAPEGRMFHSAVHDPTTDRMIMFGGSHASQQWPVPPSVALRSDVWVLDHASGQGGAAQWTQITPTSGPAPSPRAGHSAVFDPSSNRMVVFGGNANVGYCDGARNDLWVLTHANGLDGTPAWIQLAPSGGPSPRSAHVAAYDPASNRMMVCGGFAACAALPPGYWVLTHANGLGGTPQWIQLTTQGSAPPSSEPLFAAYDAASNRLVAVGVADGYASGCDDVWVLEHANGVTGTPTWVRVFPTGTPPEVINETRVAYDPQNDRLTMFGGWEIATYHRLDKVWVLEEATAPGGSPHWVTFTREGAWPAARDEVSLVQAAPGRVTLFGGKPDVDASTGDVTFNDVWVLTLGTGGPSIEVAPASVDFGDVEAFTECEQIVTITNVGDGDLTVSDLGLSGSASFDVALPGGVTLPFVVEPGKVFDATVTFFPTSADLHEAVLTVTSDDPSHGTTTVDLVGNGLAGSAGSQTTLLEEAVQDAIETGAIVGEGNGSSAAGRLKAFANVVRAAGDLVEAELYDEAATQLRAALARIDGSPRPPDFVTGVDAAAIRREIEYLLVLLEG